MPKRRSFESVVSASNSVGERLSGDVGEFAVCDLGLVGASNDGRDDQGSRGFTDNRNQPGIEVCVAAAERCLRLANCRALLADLRDSLLRELTTERGTDKRRKDDTETCAYRSKFLEWVGIGQLGRHVGDDSGWFLAGQQLLESVTQIQPTAVKLLQGRVLRYDLIDDAGV